MDNESGCNVLSFLQFCGEESVSVSSWTYDGFKQQIFRAKSVLVFFFSNKKVEQSKVRTTVKHQSMLLITFCTPLAYTDPVVERK